jgi:hypothetical protein
MMRPKLRGWLAEPVLLFRPVRKIHIVQFGQGRNRGARGVEAFDRSHDVDYRFGCQPWDCSAPDMLNGSDKPFTEEHFQ